MRKIKTIIGLALAAFLFIRWSPAQTTFPILLRLKNLLDVSTTAPTDGQVLTFVASTGKWTPSTISGTGDVVGPASATDNAIARFNLTTGKLIQNSTMTVSDAGNLNAPAGGGFTLGNPATYRHLIQDSTAEGIAGSDLRIGLDESNRMLILCDREDIATDFGRSAEANPKVVVYNAAASSRSELTSATLSFSNLNMILYENQLTTYSSFVFNKYGADVAAGNCWTFNSSANIELTDTDGQQSWLYVEPKPLQTGTAAFDGVYVNVNGTVSPTYGDGTTGDGNNLIRAAVAGVTKFAVDINGATTSIMRVKDYTTTPITVSASDVKKSIVTNLGAGASIEYDLPAATVGMTVTFFVEAAYTMVLDPNGTDQIMILTNAAGDSLTSDAVVGTFITLVALQANKWYPAGYNGAWTDTN